MPTDNAELKKFMNNAAKPQGALGNKMIELMNEFHAPIWNWTLSHLTLDKTDNVIDLGCGDGVNVQRFLEICDKVTGLDYSPLCVQKFRAKNSDAIRAGRCEIVEGNVSAMPFADNSTSGANVFDDFVYGMKNRTAGEIVRLLRESNFTEIRTAVKTVEVDTKIFGKTVMDWLSVLAIK